MNGGAFDVVCRNNFLPSYISSSLYGMRLEVERDNDASVWVVLFLLRSASFRECDIRVEEEQYS